MAQSTDQKARVSSPSECAHEFPGHQELLLPHAKKTGCLLRCRLACELARAVVSNNPANRYICRAQAKQSALKVGVGEPCAGEIRAGEIRAGEVGLDEIGVGEI